MKGIQAQLSIYFAASMFIVGDVLKGYTTTAETIAFVMAGLICLTHIIRGVVDIFYPVSKS